ncbi:MAG: aspartate aminotransferase family protein [Flavobacteriaceae bacterium]|nr:MAG: aspartate aminotransferase family protein [Flavobacteriaceae bacterium]
MLKTDFFNYQAQTSEHPLALEISHAKGSYVYDIDNKAYLDFIAGVSANTLGHNHPAISAAIIKQVSKYTHVMVYGEFIQQPAVKLCKFIADHCPAPLDTTYLTNSGTEATEGALKLAKRATGRHEIIAAKNSYHGNTQGSMSVSGAEQQNRAFRPLIPGIKFIGFNNIDDLEKITSNTAAVILETIQGGAGFIVAQNNYLQKVRERCNQVGALLILDEIQSGIGRTGKLFCFEHHNIVPDIIVTGKGLGGGMPIGAFIASNQLMSLLKTAPKLGHITTFGGHPVIAAAALATLESLYQENLMVQISEKEALFRKLLQHPAILEIRGQGLMLAPLFKSPEIATKVILGCLEKGLFLFWLLFEGSAVRVTPPLTISREEITKGCAIILAVIYELELT